VTVGIGDVCGAAGALDLAQAAEAVKGNVESPPLEPFHQDIEVVVFHLEREVHVLATLAALEPDLRFPEADPRIAREHPDGVAVRPPLHHREAELVGVESLRSLQVGDLEDEL
jgi:hypothetical protein